MTNGSARLFRAKRKARRLHNQVSSISWLNHYGVAYEANPSNTHLYIPHKNTTIVFHPMCGLWVYGGIRFRGIRNLLKFIGVLPNDCS